MKRTELTTRPSVLSARHIDEPMLSFGRNGMHPDPKFGLSLYGPWTLPGLVEPEPQSLKLGIVGDRDGLASAKAFFERTRRRIEGNPDRPTLTPAFPGFEQALRCKLQFAPAWEKTIKRALVDSVPKANTFQGRVNEAVEAIAQELQRLKEAGPRPTVVVVALPEKWLKPCGIVTGGDGAIEKSTAERRLAAKVRRHQRVGQGTIVDFDPDELEELLDDEGHGEFYKRLKIRAMEIGLPVQICKPATFTEGKGLQHIATRAWNLSVALYHKAGGYPWRLQHLDQDTCYVGISFYRDPDKNMRTSMAHIFTPTGRGLVLRGIKIPWPDNDKRSPHLPSAEMARDLLTSAINLYRSHQKTPPRRVVVHKTSNFWIEEREGFEQAAEGIAELDLVAIQKRGIKLFRHGQKAPLRGSMVELGSGNFVIYTKGYVPFLRCYPGPRVPDPIEVVEHVGDSTPEALAREILALSKMNYNNADYGDLMPITLRFADQVGEILAEMPEEMDPPQENHYYM